MWGCAANVFGAVNNLSTQIMVTGRISIKFVMVRFGKVMLYEFMVGWVGIG
jgi:hypothetical protein